MAKVFKRICIAMFFLFTITRERIRSKKQVPLIHAFNNGKPLVNAGAVSGLGR